MKVEVQVVPRSSQQRIIARGDKLKIYVHASATDGKANNAVRILLAEHYKVAKSYIRIVKGEKSRNKIIEIVK